MHTSYPTAADVGVYLKSLGLTRADGSAVADSPYLQVSPKCAAAAAAWERETLWTPYLSTGSNEDRFYDPPQETRFLPLGTGLLSVTTLTTAYVPAVGTVGQPGYAAAAGFVQALGLGFRLLPMNAPNMGRAYEVIEFLSAGFGLSGGMGYPFSNMGYGYAPYGRAGSVKVTGTFGRTLAVPDDVWQAVLERAVTMCLPAIQTNLTAGYLTYSEEGVAETFAADPLKAIRDQFQSGWQELVEFHKRVLSYS